MLASQGNYREAEDLFREVIRIDPKNLPPRGELAMLLERTGKKAEAKKLYDEILSIKPDDRGARNALKRLKDV